MTEEINPFQFRYTSPDSIVFGRDCVTDIGTELQQLGLERSLLVCGQNVGSTPGVIDPINDGLGDRLVAVFDETTPEKYLRTAYEGAKLVKSEQIDNLIAVGGGSTLDTARVISALAAHNRPLRDVAADSIEQGSVPVPDDRSPIPIVAVPTTLAGAGLSTIAGVKLTMEPDETPNQKIPSGGVGDPQLMPIAVFSDPNLFETTPESILTASAMNGFDKGIEVLYTRNRTPVTDATAMRGLRLLQSGLPTLTEEPMDDDKLSQAITGTILAQYGVSVANNYKLSIIHAFGHGFSQGNDVHQGTIHGVVAPHVLQYLFDNVDGRRELLAEALAVNASDNDEISTEAVVEAVADIRDELGLPSQLRSINGLTKDDLPDIAAAIMDDGLMETVPKGLDPTAEDIETVLQKAW